jgi:eukaryotic-like serine/threonine-protein kinase
VVTTTESVGFGMSKYEAIEQLLANWDELREQGQEVSAEQLCADSPDILPVLKTRIDQLKAMDWLDSTVDDFAHSAEAPKTDNSHEARLGDSRIPATLGGRYEMESLLAEGGFSQVWRATDRSLQRPVAVKVTTENCYSEARRVAQLKHHGIVTVHDVGNEDGLCYIVFDLLDGSTLAERIKQGTPSWQESAQIVVKVAEYVQFAHDKGFIHRDIKPANILLDTNGSPVLADFGIAVTECELRHEAVTSVGTLAYMAPEQLQVDGSIDTRTDVYSLGVVLYELLTGRLPFSKPTLSSLRRDILTEKPPSPRALNPEIPEELEGICLKCLSKKSNDRFPTAVSLAEHLQRLSVSTTDG